MICVCTLRAIERDLLFRYIFCLGIYPVWLIEKPQVEAC